MPVPPQTLTTSRLTLRRWLPRDLKPFAAMCADPKVMEYFPAPLTEEQTRGMIEKLERKFDRHGFCFWAAELKTTQEFVGIIGLGIPYFEAHFTPCVEVGWRLATAHWGQGYATEGARASIDFGFSHLPLEEIVAVTASGNLSSRRVMERLGMVYDPQGDFDHPNVPESAPHRRHVLYRISRPKVQS
jgi:RimJ/RimL family protein N-acetyltransferase